MTRPLRQHHYIDPIAATYGEIAMDLAYLLLLLASFWSAILLIATFGRLMENKPEVRK